MVATMHMNIGKNGLTARSIEMIKNAFKKHKQLRITILKSFTRDKDKINETTKEIMLSLGKGHYSKIIGFKIIISKR